MKLKLDNISKERSLSLFKLKMKENRKSIDSSYPKALSRKS